MNETDKLLNKSQEQRDSYCKIDLCKLSPEQENRIYDMINKSIQEDFKKNFARNIELSEQKLTKFEKRKMFRSHRSEGLINEEKI